MLACVSVMGNNTRIGEEAVSAGHEREVLGRAGVPIEPPGDCSSALLMRSRIAGGIGVDGYPSDDNCCCFPFLPE